MAVPEALQGFTFDHHLVIVAFRVAGPNLDRCCRGSHALEAFVELTPFS